ncbi:hypothetical protein EG329_012025 [Mollisiaceae sp. DMI_Dod_QoI]|nr:hypothetical protein EG329_012025 [Helotiales sp. DMI_Dod_QoI]
MAAGQKLYPRATVKKIVKAHSKRNVSKNVDVLVRVPDASPKTSVLTFAADIPRLRPLSANIDEGGQYQCEAGGRARNQREERQESDSIVAIEIQRMNGLPTKDEDGMHVWKRDISK